MTYAQNKGIDTGLLNHSETLRGGSPVHSRSNYMGEVVPDNFLILMVRSRDSDILTESNWHTALTMLKGESARFQIHRFSSWACGWFEYLFIDCNDAKAVKTALAIEEKLSDYPVLNDEDYSNREYDSASDVWESYSAEDRVYFLRSHEHGFESLAGLLHCVRTGEYLPDSYRELL